MARLAAALVAPAVGQLLALEVLAGGPFKKDAAQLWKATPSLAGLQYDAVGPQHSTTLKSTSTCVDSKSGVLYYVGGTNKSVEASEYVLYGLATATGEQVSQFVLPTPNRSVMFRAMMLWKLGCADGGVYLLGDWDLNPTRDPTGHLPVDWPPPATRSLMRYDAATGNTRDLANVPVNCYSITAESFPALTHNHAVAPESGLVSVIDFLTLIVVDTKTGAIPLTHTDDHSMPCTQVYDSKLSRFFGICDGWTKGTSSVLPTQVPFSCWWTASKAPQLLVQLEDWSDCDRTISTVDVTSRIALFRLDNKLSTVSLDTGKIMSQMELRSKSFDLYSEQSSGASAFLL